MDGPPTCRPSADAKRPRRADQAAISSITKGTESAKGPPPCQRPSEPPRVRRGGGGARARRHQLEKIAPPPPFAGSGDEGNGWNIDGGSTTEFSGGDFMKSSSRAATLPNPRIVANPPSAAITGAGGSAGWHGSQPHVLPRCDCSVLLRHRLIRVALFSDVTGGEWRCCLAQVCADWSCTPNRPLGQTAYGTFTRVVWNCVFGCLCARKNVLVVGRGVAHSATYVRTRSQKSGAQ